MTYKIETLHKTWRQRRRATNVYNENEISFHFHLSVNLNHLETQHNTLTRSLNTSRIGRIRGTSAAISTVTRPARQQHKQATIICGN